MSRPYILVGSCVFTAFLVAEMAPVPDDKPATEASAPEHATSGEAHARPPGLFEAEAAQTVIRRDEAGQFHLSAQVDGEDTRFLVDTGADMVALTVEDAQRLGYPVDPSQFEPLTQTASGVGYGTTITLDRLEVGGSTFRNVDAVVMDGLGENLLGQTVLRRLGKLEMRGDTMVLHHS
jgi:aspartyl protease family protein